MAKTSRTDKRVWLKTTYTSEDPTHDGKGPIETAAMATTLPFTLLRKEGKRDISMTKRAQCASTATSGGTSEPHSPRRFSQPRQPIFFQIMDHWVKMVIRGYTVTMPAPPRFLRDRQSMLKLQHLILPQARQNQAITMAHSVLMAGHLGSRRTNSLTTETVFHHKAVAEACRICPFCQKTARKPSVKVPLHPMPVMSEPFECVAIDIVGPLHRRHSTY